MNAFRSPAFRPARRSAALLATLAVLVIVTMLVVGFTSMMMSEGNSARGHRDRQNALAAANVGFDVALAQLRGAIPTNSIGNPASTTFWSSQPGRIVVFNQDGSVATNVFLYSGADPVQGLVTNVSGDQADLNRASYLSEAPIGGSMTSPMKVGWVNVLRDPSQPAGASAAFTNAVVARYGYWIDDEASKVNINTADGTSKGTTNSYGEGYPTEVSLGALGGGFASSAQQIVSNAWNNGFQSERDVLGISGVTRSDYLANKFNITAFSCSPDANVFGEPRIYLAQMNAGLNAAGAVVPAVPVQNVMVGPFNPQQPTNPIAPALSEIYPSSSQFGNFALSSPGGPVLPYLAGTYTLPPLAAGLGSGNLPQFYYWTRPAGFSTWTNDINFPMRLRLLQYMKGASGSRSLTNRAAIWPNAENLSGISGGSLTNKYTPAQLESIAIQIGDLMGKVNCESYDANGAMTNFSDISATINGNTVLDTNLNVGIGRGPKLVEVWVAVTGIQKSVSDAYGNPYLGGTATVMELNFQIIFGWYLPVQYAGMGGSIQSGYTIGWLPSSVNGYSWGGWNQFGFVNNYDEPIFGLKTNIVGATTNVTWYTVGPGVLSTNAGTELLNPGSCWMNNLLRVKIHGTGLDAGVDMFGSDAYAPDPDQVRAKAYHPWRMFTNSIATTGGGIVASPASPVYLGVGWGDGTNAGYTLNDPLYTNGVPLTGLANPTGLNPVTTMATPWQGTNSPPWNPGDALFTISTHNIAGYNFETTTNVTSVDIDGGLAVWVSPNVTSLAGNNEIELTPLNSVSGPASHNGVPFTAASRTRILQAVIPINITNVTAGGLPVWCHAFVLDPVVNKFAGDWKQETGAGNLPASPAADIIAHPVNAQLLVHNYIPGGYTNATYGKPDPGALWWPPVNTNMPKSQRFPSIGELQYIHTGILPDATNIAAAAGNESKLRGTPWRVLNFAPASDASQGVGTANYPDWALLDLFTVPASALPSGNTNARYLTYGGKTFGRINVNGAVIFPTNWSITRYVPLQAVFSGLSNVSYSSSVASTNAPTNTPAAIAQGIGAYMASQNAAVFRMAGEIANVPEVAASTNAFNPTRNDIVRQAIGVLTTRSSVFSVWVVGQSVKKRTGNTSYGTVERGDTVTDEVRMRYVVERYIETGADGVIGNNSSPGLDGVVGTWDDTADVPSAKVKKTVNPYNPAYKYRVIYAEQVGN